MLDQRALMSSADDLGRPNFWTRLQACVAMPLARYAKKRACVRLWTALTDIFGTIYSIHGGAFCPNRFGLRKRLVVKRTPPGMVKPADGSDVFKN